MRGALVLAALLVARIASGAEPPSAPAPSVARGDRYGRVLLDNFSTKVGVPAVTFEHALHRTRYTCRVCHADVGFAMRAGETQVSASGNEAGTHCGACHDGKLHDGRPVFRACWGWPRTDAARGCTRCHTGPDPAAPSALEELKRTLPLDAAGDLDWEAAQRRGVIQPRDFVEGVSMKRPTMRIDRDVEIRTVGTWLQNVTFSHRKHATWNGCELCHPEVFPLTRRGAARYRMDDLRAGKFCGVCHTNVAFSVDLCQRCHEGERRQSFR